MQTNFIVTVCGQAGGASASFGCGKCKYHQRLQRSRLYSQQTSPEWKYEPVKVLAYCASKAALNMMSVQLAYEFRDSDIAVNSVNPGYTATDLNGNSGPQTIEEGAAEIVRVALLDPPVTGMFLEKEGEIPW